MVEPEEYQTVEHALKYLAFADKIAHRTEGEAALLEEVPVDAHRVLDLGTGDGRLLSLLLLKCPQAHGLAVDFSPTMLEAARARFASEPRAEVREHDLSRPLPDWGQFDVVGSCFVIHHLEHARKREVYAEVFHRLEPGGVFLNFEHVASPTPWLHERFYTALGLTLADEDESNQLLDIETQLRWLRELGYEHADCLWKWRELALLAGRRPK